VQSDDMNKHQSSQNKWQQEVQGKESVQGRVGDNVITTNPDRQLFTNKGDRCEQVDDYLGTPVRHLTPRQQIAHKGSCHHRQIDQHADDPQEFARLSVGTVHKAAEHVQVNHQEEHG